MFHPVKNQHDQIMQANVRNSENTMSQAAQATAARLLLLLRARYPGWSEAFVPDLASGDPVSRIRAALQTSTYSEEEQAILLKRLDFLVDNHPGKTWDSNDEEWSSNGFFNGETSTTVMASPAETLYLVCAALLDDPRHLGGASSRAASSSSAPPSSRQDERDGKLAGLLLEQGRRIARGEHDKCSMGRQHDLLWLLQGSYLNDDGHLFVFIEDVPGYLFALLSQFVEQQILPKAPQEERSSLLVNWLVWQNSAGTDEQNPLLHFMERYSHNWQGECLAFMRASCVRMGINPDQNPCATNIQAVTTHVADLSSPVDNDATALLVCELYNASLAGGDSNMAHAREGALMRFKRQLEQTPWAEVSAEHQSISDLHTAESCFQALQRHARTLLVGGDDQRFREMVVVLSDALTAWYKDYFLGAHLPEGFAAMKSAYSEQEALFKAQSHSDVVENFFVAMRLEEHQDNRDAYWSRIEVIPGLKLDDTSLARLMDEHSSTVINVRPEDFTLETVVSLSSYDINRLFLHGLYVDVRDWTNTYRHILKTVCLWLLTPVSNDDSLSLKALKKGYDRYFLSNMLLMSLFHGEDLQLIASCKPDRWGMLFDNASSGIARCPRPPEQQVRLLSLIAPYFNEWVVDGWQLSGLLELSPEEFGNPERAQLWNAVKDRLNDLITTVGQLFVLFHLTSDQLSDDQHQSLWDFVRGRFDLLVTNKHEFGLLITLALEQLIHARGTGGWDVVQERLGKWMTDLRDLHHLLELTHALLNATQRQQVWAAVQGRLGKLILNADSLRDLLALTPEQLNDDQRRDIYKACKDKGWAVAILREHNQPSCDRAEVESPVSIGSVRHSFFPSQSSPDGESGYAASSQMVSAPNHY